MLALFLKKKMKKSNKIKNIKHKSDPMLPLSPTLMNV